MGDVNRSAQQEPVPPLSWASHWQGCRDRSSTFRELAADKRPGRFTGRFEGCTCERPPFRPRDAGQGNVGSYLQRPTREEMCRYSFASADAQSCRPWHPSPYFGECLRALAQLNSDEQRGAANVTSLPSDGARAPDAAWAADSLRPRHPPPGVPFAAIRRRTSGT